MEPRDESEHAECRRIAEIAVSLCSLGQQMCVESQNIRWHSVEACIASATECARSRQLVDAIERRIGNFDRGSEFEGRLTPNFTVDQEHHGSVTQLLIHCAGRTRNQNGHSSSLPRSGLVQFLFCDPSDPVRY